MGAVLSMLPMGRGQRLIGDGRDFVRLFPGYSHDRSHIYAVAFANGVLKVGRTCRPRQRMTEHWRGSNGKVVWAHLFSSFTQDDVTRVERRVVVALSGIARQISNSECFFADADRKPEILAAVRAAIAEGR
jgi:hypothetical protein